MEDLVSFVAQKEVEASDAEEDSFDLIVVGVQALVQLVLPLYHQINYLGRDRLMEELVKALGL